MKTVSGEIVLTKRISLSKATNVLSNFVAAENGASQAVSVYLKHASNSFNELAQFHKELKTSKHEQWSRNNGKVVKFGQRPEEKKVVPNVGDSVGCDNARKTHKRRRRNEDDDDVEFVNSADQSYSNRDKKRTKIEVGDY
ncbi:hypothetical protein NMG60_11014671 [Bertholletia excelsa]